VDISKRIGDYLHQPQSVNVTMLVEKRNTTIGKRINTQEPGKTHKLKVDFQFSQLQLITAIQKVTRPEKKKKNHESLTFPLDLTKQRNSTETILLQVRYPFLTNIS
jgi:Zn-dependent M32 family carboxypeptidase